MTNLSNIKFGIHGSCVTRDVFRLLDKEDTLAYYQARSSFCTKSQAFDKSLDLTWIDSLESQWQKRMVTFDITKTMPPFKNFNFLIVDLIDERFNIFITKKMQLVTLSKHFQIANGIEKLDASLAFKHGTTEHLNAFENGCQFFNSKIDRTQTRIIFHKANWASKYLDGITLEKLPNQEKIVFNNKLLDTLSEILMKNLSVDMVIEVPDELTVSDINHHWGIAPFHYTLEYYQAFWDILESILP